MIGSLRGKLIDKQPTQLVIEVNGVGYLVNISITTFERMPAKNEEVFLFTHLNVKEDALNLYGFLSEKEKEMFELLIGVTGVGCKSAQSILSGIQLSELKEAIQSGNIQRIVAAPGIGKKTAERLILELRDKIGSIQSEVEIPGINLNVKHDAVNALINLGYNRKTAEKFVRNILLANPSSTIEDLIKGALSNLNK